MFQHLLRLVLNVAAMFTVVLGTTNCVSSSRAAERPNILMVLVDDK